MCSRGRPETLVDVRVFCGHPPVLHVICVAIIFQDKQSAITQNAAFNAYREWLLNKGMRVRGWDMGAMRCGYCGLLLPVSSFARPSSAAFERLFRFEPCLQVDRVILGAYLLPFTVIFPHFRCHRKIFASNIQNTQRKS